MSFAGVGLCAILAIVLNMVLPKEAPNKILNEEV
jgi:uracil permease